jgi:hypothetical protein
VRGGENEEMKKELRKKNPTQREKDNGLCRRTKGMRTLPAE